jgi:hypothetical protein
MELEMETLGRKHFRGEDCHPMSPASAFRYQLVHVMKSLNGRKSLPLDVGGAEVAGLGYDR